MADIWPAARVVHGVGHVPHQYNVFSIPCQLPQTKRPAKYAHVGVDASQHDVFDFPVGKNVPDFVTSVTDVVFF